MTKKLTNRGSHADTWKAWHFYRRVRPQFLEWNHVRLTYAQNPDTVRQGHELVETKIVEFVDDAGDALELEGVNFGYNGGTPGELVEVLLSEGFGDADRIEEVVLNKSGQQTYPRTVARG